MWQDLCALHNALAEKRKRAKRHFWRSTRLSAFASPLSQAEDMAYS